MSLAIVACSGPLAAQRATSFTLGLGHAGDLRVGMTVDEVIGLFGQARVKNGEYYGENPAPEPVLEIRLRSLSSTEPSLVAHLFPPDQNGPFRTKTVYSIVVHDRRFRTEDGLGIGSTLGEIRLRHNVELGVGEGSIGGFAEDLGLTFDFSQFYPSVNVPARGKVQSLFVVPLPPTGARPPR